MGKALHLGVALALPLAFLPAYRRGPASWIALTGDRDAGVRRAAAVALRGAEGEWVRPASRALFGLQSDPHRALREVARASLVELGSKDPGALLEGLRVVQDVPSTQAIAQFSARTLQTLGPRAFPALLEVLERPDDPAWTAAVEILGSSPEAAAAVQGLADHPDARVRRGAAEVAARAAQPSSAPE